ncbi:MAG: radical SAM protein [Chloroflexota bacterium]
MNNAVNKDHLYNVSEVFYSIQGEGTRAGEPCVFIRLQGCMLRCSWCDTPYALEARQIESMMTEAQILEKVRSYGCNFIEFTGGEPLMQPIAGMLKDFCDHGFTVALETNGHASLEAVDRRVIKIMDIKCPDSRMSKFNNYRNIELLDKKDEVKFVLASREDYNFAVDAIRKYELEERVAAILLSTVFETIELRDLAEWILNDKLKVRLQVQLHKLIWEPSLRGV